MLILLAILIFVYNFGTSLLFLQHEAESAWATLLYQLLFISGFGSWLHRELKRHHIEPVYCPGILFHTASFILVPYYLYKARKVKALIPLGIFVGAFTLSKVAAVICYVIATT